MISGVHANAHGLWEGIESHKLTHDYNALNWMGMASSKDDLKLAGIKRVAQLLKDNKSA